jgi:NRPS condensation-like uncharacterized protein
MMPKHPEKIPATPLDQFNVALDAVSDQTMRLVLEFEGQLESGRLRDACVNLVKAAPVLGSRFVAEDKPYWEPLENIRGEDLLFICESDKPDQDLHRVLSRPVDTNAGPQFRVDLIRHKYDTLCISVHHAVMDARGLLATGSLLATLYRDPENRSLNGRVKAGTDCLFAQVLTTTPSPVPAPAGSDITPFTGWAFPYLANRCINRDFATRTLSPDRLAAIRTYGKSRGVTVNDILLAAYFLAICDQVRPAPGEKRPILLSIDLRRYLPGNGNDGRLENRDYCMVDEISNMSVAFDVLLPTGFSSLDEIIIPVFQEMKKHKQNTPGIASALDSESLAHEGYAAFCRHVAEMQNSCAATGNEAPMLGNIGLIQKERLVFSSDIPVTNAYIAGIVIYPPGIGMGVSTFCDRMTLSIGYCQDAIPDHKMEQFLDSVVCYLPDIPNRLR